MGRTFNRYPGPCVYCGQIVAPGEGVATKQWDSWTLFHNKCAEERAARRTEAANRWRIEPPKEDEDGEG